MRVEPFFVASAYTGVGFLALALLSPVALLTWIFIVILIIDTGAGVPLLWALLVPFFRPFKPTPAYQQLKSKFVLKS
ncbi:hypothetical protein AB1Y20_013249 [Prymnesium parvum]|uniref:Glycerophosphocholine acyltransferase 1 n=1 Tax=Prymnesium parvum TaxID=97485 RepID=A0AB34IN13_PRYPA